MSAYLIMPWVYVISCLLCYFQFRLSDEERLKLPAHLRELIPYAPFFPGVNTFYAVVFTALDIYFFFNRILFKLKLQARSKWEIFIFRQYWKIENKKIKEKGLGQWIIDFNRIFGNLK